MSLKAGRVGVAFDQVDNFGKIIGGSGPSGDYYTKTQTDNKFETKTDAASTYATVADAQPKTLAVPIEMLSGTKLTVETALQGLNTDKANTAALSGWTPASQVATGQVSFSGLDDTQGWGYVPYGWVDGNSTNKNPVFTINSISGANTNNMSVTYDTDADNGSNCKLRIAK